MGSQVTWSKIFNRPATAKRIEIGWNVDPTKEDMPFASFSVSDGESPYALNERSLGFRWFFSFLLFTRFGGARRRPNLFLFDEPATNLHTRAQSELLQSFDKIIEEGNTIVYSTHSHHMINPRWLAGAYIVENEAIDYESTGSGTDFSVLPTLVTATPYNRFVSENGGRISYFQPVLERLQYIEPSIAALGPQLMVEGPSDFFALSYVARLSPKPLDFSIVPGGGAGSLDPMIEIALSRGLPFVILLDDDKEGAKARARYIEIWSLPEPMILMLGDIDIDYKGKKLESLLSEDTIALIEATFGGPVKKKQKQMYLAESHFAGTGRLSDETVLRLERVLSRAADILSRQRSVGPR